MLNRRAFLLAAVAAAVVPALAACGPSSSQLKQAREARYQGSRDELFMAVIQAVEAEKHQVDKLDHEAGALLTAGRWFEPDGTYEDKAIGREDDVKLENGSVHLAMLVSLVGSEPPYQVIVRPQADQIRQGYSAPYRFKQDDPQLPGWVIGKVENLQLALHERLKSRMIAAPGATPAAAGN